MLKTGSVRSLLLLIIFIAFNSSSASQDLTNKLNEIESYAAKVGEDWKVPGFAIAVVKNDKIVFAKGFGIKQLGKAELVDKETIFAIASNTKAFTAAALATLVDERKIRWDDPVTKYISWFQLYDPWVTRELTVRDLLSPRSGLATFGGDLLWFESNYSREEIIRRIRFLKPAHSFRSRFGYQNIMFITAGELIPAVTGKSWDDYLRERFFVPLRMERTTTTYKQLLVTPNLALPHNEVEGKLRVVRYDNVDNAAAAGSINSSVADMAQWVRLQLNRGSLDGKKIFSAERSREMWTPNTIASGISEAAEKFSPTTHFNLYGLGWGLATITGAR